MTMEMQLTWQNINIANLPNFLQKLGSYRSRLFDVKKRCLGCLCSSDMPPTSHTEYMLEEWQSIM